MSSSGSAPSVAPARTVLLLSRAITARLLDYLELTKPRIAVLALITVAVGYLLGSAGNWQLGPLLHTLAGVGLVAAASSAFNQLLEKDVDARMDRTANRPLPAGRLSAIEVCLFGLSTGTVGIVYLALAVNYTTALLAFGTLLLYAGVYTPLKRRTSLCTAIGAIPGALPPVLGWAAASGGLDMGAVALFAILFLWQFPHFLAIGWLYRDQYARAGLRMAPRAAASTNAMGMMSVVYALVLLPISLLPSQVQLAGSGYFAAAIVLGLGYLACAVRFARNESRTTARGLLWGSLVYLPLLLISLTWNHLQLLQ